MSAEHFPPTPSPRDQGSDKIEFSKSVVATDEGITDGGVRAWVTVAGGFLIYFCGFG